MTTRLSVLLPTRNGARYLHDCVASVLATELDEMELVVSNNASEDETRDVLAAFEDDSRLRVVHQPAPLSVTDNWNATLHASQGEHLLLIGDDDCVLPGSLESLMTARIELGEPEVLSFDAYGFAFPAALGPASPAHVSDPLFRYDERLPSDGELSPECLMWCVKEAFRFQPPFCPNLQTTLISRRSLARLPRGPFCEPYPDFYATMALMLTTQRWVHLRRKLIAVGISPKSFGQSLLGGGTDAGRAYLGIETRFDGYLPGTDMINGCHITLQRLKRDYPRNLEGVDISRSDYVYRQLYSWYLFGRLGTISKREIVRRLRLLSIADWMRFTHDMANRFSLEMLHQHFKVNDSNAIASVWTDMKPAAEHRTIGEFARSHALNGSLAHTELAT